VDEYVILEHRVHTKDPHEPHRTLCGMVVSDFRPLATAEKGFCAECQSKGEEKGSDLVISK
jgi:hypothetical protein